MVQNFMVRQKQSMIKVKHILVALFFNMLLPCAVCYGATDDPMAIGMNNAVLFLLGVISFILLGIIGSIIHFYRRSKTLN